LKAKPPVATVKPAPFNGFTRIKRSWLEIDG
jgi:hypothetical protein